MIALIGCALLGCGSRIRELRPEAPMPSEHALAPTTEGPYIAGDPVWLQLPRNHDGECRSGDPDITRATREDGTIEIVLGPVPDGACPVVPSGQGPNLLRAGELDAGRYVVRCSDPACAGYEHAFEVLPEGTDPGALEPHWRIRIAVALAHPPGDCFGMPSPRDGEPDVHPYSTLREREPLLYRQLQRAYPDRDPDRLLALTRGIDVVQRSEDHWEYGYTDGECCSIREVGGHVHVERDGTIRVDPPRVFESRDVVC